jgi:hypothetical protein
VTIGVVVEVVVVRTTTTLDRLMRGRRWNDSKTGRA